MSEEDNDRRLESTRDALRSEVSGEMARHGRAVAERWDAVWGSPPEARETAREALLAAVHRAGHEAREMGYPEAALACDSLEAHLLDSLDAAETRGEGRRLVAEVVRASGAG